MRHVVAATAGALLGGIAGLVAGTFLARLLYGDAADLDRLMIGIFAVVGAGVFALCGAILAVLYSVRR